MRGTAAPVPSFMGGARKLRRELTPAMLAKVQKALSMTDFSSLIRRQSVCAVIGKSPPQMLFDEVFVSIADLRDMLMKHRWHRVIFRWKTDTGRVSVAE